MWSFAVNVRYKCGCVRMQRDFGETSERTDDVKLCVETHDIRIVSLISSIVYIKPTSSRLLIILEQSIGCSQFTFRLFDSDEIKFCTAQSVLTF